MQGVTPEPEPRLRYGGGGEGRMKKIKSLENGALVAYLSTSLNNFFPDGNRISPETMLSYIDAAEDRIWRCFSGINKKYFNDGDLVRFNHLHSDQYCMYLYMLANFIHEYDGNVDVATKLYCLNKALHSVDIYYTTALPEKFLLVHPIGTVLGRAKFGEYFVAYQGCTVGCLNDGVFPILGEKVIMYANSSVLGRSVIGNNVSIAAGVVVINAVVRSDCTVFGQYPNYILKDNNKDYWSRAPYKYE
jgi:serine O-acetyltransferase